jgi:hypothetical protein
MDQALAVCGLDRLGDLGSDRQHLLDREGTAAQSLLERLTGE